MLGLHYISQKPDKPRAQFSDNKARYTKIAQNQFLMYKVRKLWAQNPNPNEAGSLKNLTPFQHYLKPSQTAGYDLAEFHEDSGKHFEK